MGQREKWGDKSGGVKSGEKRKVRQKEKWNEKSWVKRSGVKCEARKVGAQSRA